MLATKSIILGTAGHVDHGKTAFVKALTGTDCDRLQEEKERGITIVLLEYLDCQKVTIRTEAGRIYWKNGAR